MEDIVVDEFNPVRLFFRSRKRHRRRIRSPKVDDEP